MKKYYYAGTTRIAVREGTGNQESGLTYLFGDHLGSTSTAANPDGTNLRTMLYKAWGEVRYSSGGLPTKHQYTGQINDGFGLYFYNARYYDSYLNHWVQPDSIIPDPYNPLDWDRYAYTRNNSLKYTDPSGHFCYDSDKNEFSDGDCFDDMQQELLDYFVVQLESGDYSDLELMENLLNKALGLNSDSVIALRAASEIVRESTPKGFGWSYEAGSKFFYGNYTNATFDDSGFGDLMDTETPNQIAHTIGITYIAAYQKRAGLGLFTGALVWGNEVGNQQSVKQTNIDRDLGYIAMDLGNALVANKSETISDAVSQIESYNYAKNHTPWWQKIKWPWAK